MRLIAWLVLVGVNVAVVFASRLAEGKPPKDLVYRYSLAIGALVQFVILGAILLAIARGRVLELLALRRPSSWSRAAGIAVLVVIVTVVVGALLEPLLHPTEEQGLAPSGWDPSRAGAFAASFVAIAVGAPIIEELTFRGLGYSLLSKFGHATASLVTACGWALAHGIVEGVPIFVVFGLGLAHLRARTNSVYPGIALHGAYNAAALTLSVTT